jgi:hypothetical protein
MLDDDQRTCNLIYILVIVMCVIFPVSVVYCINYHHDNNTNAIVGTWTSENVFGEDFEHIVVVCSSDGSGYITKNNVTLPLTWEQRPFGMVLCISDNLIVSVVVAQDASSMTYYDTYKIKLYRVDNECDLI